MSSKDTDEIMKQAEEHAAIQLEKLRQDKAERVNRHHTHYHRSTADIHSGHGTPPVNRVSKSSKDNLSARGDVLCVPIFLYCVDTAMRMC